MRRITVQFPGPAIRIENHPVIESGGAETGNARHQALSPAAVAGDQVVDNLTGQNDAVRLEDFAVDLDHITEAGHADFHERCVVSGYVVEKTDAPGDLGTHDEFPFLGTEPETDTPTGNFD